MHIEEGRPIGEKRNFGSELARGEVVASWDDDDWSAPGRLTDQLNRLRQSGKAVTGYHSMLFTDGLRWLKFKGQQRANLGTSLVYLKSWWKDHRFPARQVFEDGEFIREAMLHSQYTSADAGELMVASIHGENSSPRRLTGDSWIKLIKIPEIPGYE